MHIPVLLHEVLSLFEGMQVQSFLDGTLGLGGHASALMAGHSEVKQYVGIDRDAHALTRAKNNLQPYESKLCPWSGPFSEFAKALKQYNLTQVDGILLDLGVSSLQLDTPERGFSFRFDGPLDMRMDQSQPLTAARLLNEASEEKLLKIFREYGEMSGAHRLVEQIIKRRQEAPFDQIADLLELKPPFQGRMRKKIHPFTLVFQALRIAVNEELSGLSETIRELFSYLSPGGRLAIITFHSLEDRIVKHTMRALCSRSSYVEGSGKVVRIEPQGTLLTRKPIIATESEIQENPRSRSAKLRAVQKEEV